MKINIPVNVTQKHIDIGDISKNSCPVALALKDVGVTSPVVFNDFMTGYYKGEKFWIDCPKEISDWIIDFDMNPDDLCSFEPNRGAVKPFSFELPIDDMGKVISR